MAADFNAGSIEGTLGLDSTPFKDGLRMAKAQADEFAKQKVTPEADLDTTGFKSKKDVASAELDKFGHSKATAKADIDIAPALAKYAILSKVLDAGGFGKGATSVGLMTGKVFALVGGIMSLIAVMGPLGGVIAGLGGAGIAAFGGLAIALALFSGAAKTAFSVITEANKAGVDLTGWAGKAQDALKGLTDGWHKLVDSVKPEMFRLFTVVFSGVADILPRLAPLLQATTAGVSDLVKSVLVLSHTQAFSVFLKDLASFAHGFLSGAGPVINALLMGFMSLFHALVPLMSVVGNGISDASEKFEHFSQALASGGIRPFITYVMKWLPEVFHLFGSVFTGIRNLVAGLTPLAGPAIHFIEALVTAIGNLHLAPLARGFGDMLDALTPLLPVLGDLVNTVLGPLGHLLSGIATDAIIPFTHALRQEMHPALAALHTILHALVEPLSLFAASIANLANPTGVHLITALLVGLSGAVVALAPSLSRLAVALESVIDDGLEVIIPLIPTLSAALAVAVGAVTFFADGLASILSHKAVVDVLLGLTAAVWLGVKAFQVYRAAVLAVGVVSGVIEAVTMGWAGLTVAQDASTASVIANRVGMVAFRVAAIATSVATKAMAAAQWLLNAAMDANPIGIIILALAALAAGFIYAYKHSETFRNIVNGALHAVQDVAKTVFGWLTNAVGNVIDFIRAHWQLLLSIMTGPIGAILIYVITHFSQIRSAFSNLMSDVSGFVSNGIDNVVGFFTSLPGRILALDGMMLNAGKSLMGAIFRGLESAASAVGGFAANIASSIWHELESVLNNVLPHTLSINKGPIHINVPLFPQLAEGGVTSGPMNATIGDNPGGREAVIPLDKYDLPSRGDTAQLAARSHDDSARIIALLSVIAQKAGIDPDAMAEALGNVLKTHGDDQNRRLLQMTRAA